MIRGKGYSLRQSAQRSPLRGTGTLLQSRERLKTENKINTEFLVTHNPNQVSFLTPESLRDKNQRRAIRTPRTMTGVCG